MSHIVEVTKKALSDSQSAAIATAIAAGCKVKVGYYTGNGVGGSGVTRTIAGVGFQPDIVIVWDVTPGSGAAVAIRSLHDTPLYGKWTNLGYDKNNINSFTADGFTIGYDSATYINNPDGRRYCYMCIKAN